MTTRIAVYLVILIAAAVSFDVLANEGEASTFLSRKFIDLVEWVAFWR